MPRRTVRRYLTVAALIAVAWSCLKQTKQNSKNAAYRTKRNEQPYRPISKSGVTVDFPEQNISSVQTHTDRHEEQDKGQENPSERSVADSTRTIARLTGALVIVGVLSAGVSGLQWWEIRSGSSDTHALAQAAVDQAKAATESSRTARDTLIASSRAWVGFTSASIDQPIDNVPIIYHINYANSGHEPARSLAYSTHAEVLSINDFTGNAGWIAMKENFDACFGTNQSVGGVAYPGASYSLRADTNSDAFQNVDGSYVSDKNKAIIIVGCVTYISQKVIRHSSFCFYNLSGRNEKENLSFCPGGNNAD